MANKISNSEIHIFWNIHNTIFNMLVIDEIIQRPRVCVHLQTNTAVSRNGNASERSIAFSYIYTWIGITPHYMRVCCNNRIKQSNTKLKNKKNNYNARNNHLWGHPVSIQMQCLFLIKLLNKRKIKSLQ
jgi:hypothetical protein